MTKATEILKKLYLSNIKENPELFIGVELEFPIVNLTGRATDLSVTKALLPHLVEVLDFQVEKSDLDGYPVQIFNPRNDDRILFEVSYNILEMAFGKARQIQEIETRFNRYLEVIQLFLRAYDHEIQGKGIHPYWDINDNRAVKLPRYQMLLDFLALSEHKENTGFYHQFPQYGSFICGNQVQLDISQQNYLRVINAFNKIEAAKAYLFANSTFSGADWNTRLSRDLFWERSMHGVYEENVGISPTPFLSEEAYFTYLSKSAIFTAERDGKVLYFEPIQVCDYLTQGSIKAWDLNGRSYQIAPEEADFNTHRSYHYQDLTRRGTIEFRSVCTQPLNQTFAPTAFHLGLFANFEVTEDLLATSPFFEEVHMNQRELRHYFSQKHLSKASESAVAAFSRGLLECAIEGLKDRGYQEEKYLDIILQKRKKVVDKGRRRC